MSLSTQSKFFFLLFSHFSILCLLFFQTLLLFLNSTYFISTFFYYLIVLLFSLFLNSILVRLGSFQFLVSNLLDFCLFEFSLPQLSRVVMLYLLFSFVECAGLHSHLVIAVNSVTNLGTHNSIYLSQQVIVFFLLRRLLNLLLYLLQVFTSLLLLLLI